MSYAICRMQKMKSHDLKGMQFHNQRERESKTNPDIDETRTYLNYDLVNSEQIDYNKKVKEIIESQKVSTCKTRKDAVLVNELIVTSDKEFFERLDPEREREFFEESLKFYSERYGEQNIAYATVHKDEKTPHLHLGVVPMRDGRLQGKNVFNRFELLAMQEEFPKRMQELGFDIERGEKGSTREHLDTTRFKLEQTKKEKEILEKDISAKKNELLILNEKVPNEVKIPAKRQFKNVEIESKEKNIFGRPKKEIKKEPTGNVIVSETDFKKMMAAAKDNERLKNTIKKFTKMDLYTENQKLGNGVAELREELKSTKEELQKEKLENADLKSLVVDLRHEINSIYQSTKEFIKERTEGLRAFKEDFKDLVDKIKEKTYGSEFERLNKREKSRERNRGLER